MSKKKPAKKTTRKSAATTAITIDQLRKLPRGTEFELTVKATMLNPMSASFEIEDSDGDEHIFSYENVLVARTLPKQTVKVSGAGAERAAAILREKGFDVV